jgi:hypothetical protein
MPLSKPLAAAQGQRVEYHQLPEGHITVDLTYQVVLNMLGELVFLAFKAASKLLQGSFLLWLAIRLDQATFLPERNVPSGL